MPPPKPRRISGKSRDHALEQAILDLLTQRGAGKTICPSEVARAVAGSNERAVWEPLMEPARAAARRLAASGRVVVTQSGHPVDPTRAHGPIRLRLAEGAMELGQKDSADAT